MEMKDKTFRDVNEFLHFCYRECPDVKIGCMISCKLREHVRNDHPDWFNR